MGLGASNATTALVLDLSLGDSCSYELLLVELSVPLQKLVLFLHFSTQQHGQLLPTPTPLQNGPGYQAHWQHVLQAPHLGGA